MPYVFLDLGRHGAIHCFVHLYQTTERGVKLSVSYCLSFDNFRR